MSVDTKYTYNYPSTDLETICSQEAFDSFFSNKQVFYKPGIDETILILVRHGQNESNVSRLFGGRTIDTPLTPAGYEQSDTTGKKLATKVSQIDQIMTPPMCRTTQTARKILESFPSSTPKFSEDTSLHERCAGEYEGKSLVLYEEVNKEDKKTSALTTVSFKAKMEFTPGKGVETYAAVWDRTYRCLYQACNENRGGAVLCVADSGVVRASLWHLLANLGGFVTYGNSKPANGSYMIVSVKEASMTLLETDGITIIPPTNQ